MLCATTPLITMRGSELTAMKAYQDCSSLIALTIWALFNYTPKDLFYRIARFCAPLIAILRGYISARDLILGLEVGVELFDSTMDVFSFAIGFGVARYVILIIFGRLLKQPVREFGPVLFTFVVGAVFHNGLVHGAFLPERFKWLSQIAELLTIGFVSLLCFLRQVIPDDYYDRQWNRVVHLIALFIPYYGKTWIPDLQPVEAQ
jgi:hypothetical protein